MKVTGIQKLTLLDYPGVVACTVFTAGCNFRCPFCHNAMLVLPEQIDNECLTDDEVFDIAPVERSKEMLLSGETDYEFRTTVVKGIHTKESLIGAAKWIEGAKEYYLQQFKDSGNLILPDGLAAYDEKQMHALADAVRDYVPTVEVRGV